MYPATQANSTSPTSSEMGNEYMPKVEAEFCGWEGNRRLGVALAWI